MNQIRETIRRQLEDDMSPLDADITTNEIMNDLIDHRLIGLPTDVRTSVDTKLIEDVGKKFGCRPGEDADDICRAVLR